MSVKRYSSLRVLGMRKLVRACQDASRTCCNLQVNTQHLQNAVWHLPGAMEQLAGAKAEHIHHVMVQHRHLCPKLTQLVLVEC
jgi:hypothetical protein